MSSTKTRLTTIRLLMILFTLFVSPLTVQSQTEEEIGNRDELLLMPNDIDSQARRAAREEGFSLLKGFGTIWGVDENVYRSPDNLKNDGEFQGLWALLRADIRWGNKERLMSKMTWQQTQYPGHSNADIKIGELKNWYTKPLTDTTSIELALKIKHKNDDATDIFGDTYKRDYAYWRYTASGFWVWKMAKNHRLKLGGGYVFKDYDETSGINSLDWNEKRVRARYRYRFGKFHTLKLSYSLTERNYEEELAGLRNGIELPENPEEKHRYHDFGLLYSFPVNKKLKLGIGYSYERKDDRFQDYESYDSNVFEFRAALKVSKKTAIRLKAKYTIQKYDNILGDKGNELEYEKTNISMTVQHRLTDSFSIIGNIAFYDRDTNKSFGAIYRDYRGLIYTMGVSYFF